MSSESMNNYHANEKIPYQVCETAAEIYAGKEWDTLTVKEMILIKYLVRADYLTKTENGFVGDLVD